MRARSTAVLLAAVCLLALLAPLAVRAALTGPVYDFNGHLGKFTSQVRQSGTKFYMKSFTLLCSSQGYVVANASVLIKTSGAFSYSGRATLISGPKDKASKTRFKASGKISIAKKTGTAKASTTAKHCPSFSGKLTGVLVPVTSPG
jgi:hypothetical protein